MFQDDKHQFVMPVEVKPDGPITQLLVRARARISDPQHWTTEGYSKDKYGYLVDFWASDAFSFCSVGAIARESKAICYSQITDGFIGSQMTAGLIGRTIRLLRPYMRNDIFSYNDTHSHAEVLKVWDKAIAWARQEGV